MNFLDLPLKSRRAAFAKMDAADKAKKGSKLSKPKPAAKKAATKKAAPAAKPSQQVSRQYRETGKPTAADVDTLIANYRTMHGKDPSPAQLAKLRRKRR